MHKHRPRALGPHTIKQTLALLCALLMISALVPWNQGKAAAAPAVTPVDASTPPPFTDYPTLSESGFLCPDCEEEEFVHEDPENGQYIYISRDLRVEINRHQAVHEKRKLVWFIADIRFQGYEAFRAFLADPGNYRIQARPSDIALRNKVVYAQNGDLFTWRYYNKKTVGLIIRSGKPLHKTTYNKPLGAVPPLDELALYPDGTVEMNHPGRVSPEEYLQKGAMDVLAFGPILFRDGVKDSRLSKHFAHREPRSALGVVEPGHFIGILVEGRNERSVGASLNFVADRLMELGCVEAFTLDGGQTASMIFMGKEVMDPGIYNGFQKARLQQDIIGIGTSPKVKK